MILLAAPADCYLERFVALRVDESTRSIVVFGTATLTDELWTLVMLSRSRISVSTLSLGIWAALDCLLLLLLLTQPLFLSKLLECPLSVLLDFLQLLRT